MQPSPVVDALWPGNPYLRGAARDGLGVNFAFFSEHAEHAEHADQVEQVEQVEFCRFDASGRNEIAHLALSEQRPTRSSTATYRLVLGPPTAACSTSCAA